MVAAAHEIVVLRSGTSSGTHKLSLMYTPKRGAQVMHLSRELHSLQLAKHGEQTTAEEFAGFQK
jgi:hypothetical protein